MAIPTIPGSLDSGSATGTGSVTLSWMGLYQPNDVGIIIVESSGGDPTLTITTPSGWSQVTGSPVVDVATTAGSKLQVFWKRITTTAGSNPEPDVILPSGGNHIIAALFAVRGCITSGNPWDVISTGQKSTASTSITFPSLTTTVSDCAILLIATRPNSSISGSIFSNLNLSGSALTNTDQVGVRNGTTSGNGGGFVRYTGEKATPGSIGTHTATTTSSLTSAYMVIAFRGIVRPTSNTSIFNINYVNKANFNYTIPQLWATSGGGGDWWDATGVANGTTPWATQTVTDTDTVKLVSFDVTKLFQSIYDNPSYCSAVIIGATGSSINQYFAGNGYTTDATKQPKISYDGGADQSITDECAFGNAYGAGAGVNGSEQYVAPDLGTSASGYARWLLVVPPPSTRPTSATLKVWTTQQFGDQDVKVFWLRYPLESPPVLPPLPKIVARLSSNGIFQINGIFNEVVGDGKFRIVRSASNIVYASLFDEVSANTGQSTSNFTYTSDSPTTPGTVTVSPSISTFNGMLVIAGVASGVTSTFAANTSSGYNVASTSDPDVVIYKSIVSPQSTSPTVDIGLNAENIRISGFVFKANTSSKPAAMRVSSVGGVYILGNFDEVNTVT